MDGNKGITLIGMSEAGQTTLGPILGQELDWPVSDIDDMIIKSEGKLIGEVLEEKGQEYLLDLETQCVKSLELYQSVLVTPGSIIYDIACHQQLKAQTIIVWLSVPLGILKERFGRDSKKARAVVGINEDFEELFNKRQPLYANLADLKVECGDMKPKKSFKKLSDNCNKSSGSPIPLYFIRAL